MSKGDREQCGFSLRAEGAHLQVLHPLRVFGLLVRVFRSFNAGAR